MSETNPHQNFEPAGILPTKYPELHNSQEVQLAVSQHEGNLPNSPEATVGVYLGSLVGKHGLLGGEAARRDAQIAHRVIKAENIPEGYYENQRRIAREQGHGEIEITDEMKKQLSEAIISDQTKSLETWVDYINEPDANYPAWFRYFTVRNVLKMSDYDKEKQAFRTRSSGTTSPFPDLNREALAYVYDAMQQRLGGEVAEDETVRKLVDGANFSKLYAHAIREVTPASAEMREVTEGEWVKFYQTNDPKQGMELAKSLQGHGTGWCTAGESTAKMQLSGGDFYVFYSYDDNNEATVPRVAIRMQNHQVAEVRGINASQELEPVMVEKAEAKLADLPGGEAYKQKAADMKHLTELERKVSKGEVISLDELRFLYEIDHPIEGFGYEKDPRIQELRSGRDQRTDLAKIFDTSVDNIATNLSEVNNSTVVLMGGLKIAEARTLLSDNQNVKWIDGELSFEGIGEGSIDSVIATRLIDVGQTMAVAHNLDRFKTMPAEVASTLIDLGQAAYVANKLRSFSHLDESIADRLIEAGQAERVATGASVFEGIDRTALATKLMWAGEYTAVAKGLASGNRFYGLKGQFVEPLIEAGYSYEVAYNLNQFKDVDFNAVANKMIDKGAADKMYLGMRNFSGLDESVALRLIEAGQAKMVAHFLNSFDKLDSSIAATLVEAGEGWEVAQRLDRFNGIDKAMEERFMADPDYAKLVAFNSR